MCHARIVLLGCAAFALLCPLAAQEPPGPIAQLFVVQPKRGHEQEFEQAYQQHLDWHRQRRDDWEWVTWQYETGERFGQYVIRSGSHHWKDFDVRGDVAQKDESDALERLTPHMESVLEWITESHYELSRVPSTVSLPRMVEVIDFHLKPGTTLDFIHSLKQINEALDKANWPSHYLWTELLAGGEGPVFSLVVMHDDWVSFQTPEKSFLDVLDEVYGRQGTQQLRETLWSCVSRQESNILRLRSDLTYLPEGQ